MFTWLMKKLHAPVYASRLRELVRQITPHLRQDDRVLDVGCGFGALGKAIVDDPACPARVSALGLERARRGGELIPVEVYDGRTIPHDDGEFDVVVLADVLHHEQDPHQLISECRRVAGRLLIIKDHKIDGLLAQRRIALIDWAANAPYAVPCLYRYNALAEWRDWHRRHHLSVEHEVVNMRLYPPVVNMLFGRRLQYFAVLRVPSRDSSGEAGRLFSAAERMNKAL